MQDAAFEYAPRHPEKTVLYQVVAEQLETFLTRQQERDRPVPRFVEEEFRSFLDCGLLARVSCAFIASPADTTGCWRCRVLRCGKLSAVPTQRRRENSM